MVGFQSSRCIFIRGKIRCANERHFLAGRTLSSCTQTHTHKHIHGAAELKGIIGALTVMPATERGGGLPRSYSECSPPAVLTRLRSVSPLWVKWLGALPLRCVDVVKGFRCLVCLHRWAKGSKLSGLHHDCLKKQQLCSGVTHARDIPLKEPSSGLAGS